MVQLGKILPLIIKRTIDIDEGEYKDFLVFTIANHMKKSYLTWNKANVEDEVILKHLSHMQKKASIIKIKVLVLLLIYH